MIKWPPLPPKSSIVFIVVRDSMDLPPRRNYIVHGLKPSRVSMFWNNKVLQMWFVVVCRSSTPLFLESRVSLMPVCLFIIESISKNCAGSRS